LAYSEISIEDAVSVIVDLPSAVREAVSAIPTEARRFRYNDCDFEATLDELAAAAAGFCEQVARTEQGDWDRIATRLPGEDRTARWLVRQAMHEGVHHLGDICRVGGISG